MKGNKLSFPSRHRENRPGIQSKMKPQPLEEREAYIPAGKLRSKVALIPGTDSGIGRDVAILYAREGADISAVYFNKHEDARETERQVKEDKRKYLLMGRTGTTRRDCAFLSIPGCGGLCLHD